MAMVYPHLIEEKLLFCILNIKYTTDC